STRILLRQNGGHMRRRRPRKELDRRAQFLCAAPAVRPSLDGAKGDLFRLRHSGGPFQEALMAVHRFVIKGASAVLGRGQPLLDRWTNAPARPFFLSLAWLGSCA